MNNPVIKINVPRDSLSVNLTVDDLFGLKNQTSELLYNFCDCIGIPNDLFSVIIDFAHEKPLQISIHNYSLPIEIYIKNKLSSYDESSLVYAFYNAIVANREYILNDNLSEEIGKYYNPDHVIPNDILVVLFKRLIYHGIHLRKPFKDFVQLFNVKTDSEWIENQIEILISTYSKEKLLIKIPESETTISNEQIRRRVISRFWSTQSEGLGLFCGSITPGKLILQILLLLFC